MARRIPLWAWVALPLLILAGFGIRYMTDPDLYARKDECIGATVPIERGALMNRCDHAISVLGCPGDRGGNDGCEEQGVAAGARFAVRADVQVVTHACEAPYVATMTRSSQNEAVWERGCRSVE